MVWLAKFWNFIVDNSLLAIIIAVIGWFAVWGLNNWSLKKERRLLLRIKAYEQIVGPISDMIAQYREIVSKVHHVNVYQIPYDNDVPNPREIFFLKQNIPEHIFILRELNNQFQVAMMRYINSFDDIKINVNEYYAESQDLCNNITDVYMNIGSQIEISNDVPNLHHRLETMRHICERAFSFYGSFQDTLSRECYKGLYKNKQQGPKGEEKSKK